LPKKAILARHDATGANAFCQPRERRFGKILTGSPFINSPGIRRILLRAAAWKSASRAADEPALGGGE
jgi:hypothetical protein